jgi:FMN phosphatase YigB (HAD superfamily)
MSELTDVKALLFDVFGTVVDWHGSVTQELEKLGKEHAIGLSPHPSLLKLRPRKCRR